MKMQATMMDFAIILPDWNSLESIRRAHSDLEAAALVFFALLVVCEALAHLSDDKKTERRFDKIGIVFFAIAVLAEVVAYPYGQRNDTLSGQIIGSLDSETREALIKSATALAQSKEAETKSGDAIDKAGKAQESLGNAENEANRAQRASSNALGIANDAKQVSREARQEADSFEKDIVSAKAQAADAESHLADALQRVTEAQSALEKLKTPRKLNPEQQERIASKLKPFSGTQFDVAITVAPEPQDFLPTVEGVLEMAEWTELDWTQSNTVVFMRPPPHRAVGIFTLTGVAVQVHKEQVDKLWGAATALAEALKAEGVDARAEPRVIPPNDNNNAIHILIGEKPKE